MRIFLLLGLIYSATLAQNKAELPVIIQDEAQARPSRLMTKTYDVKSPEYAFWSKYKEQGAERATKLAEAAIQLQQLSDQLRNHEGVDPDREKNEAKEKQLSEFLSRERAADLVPIHVKFLKWSRERNKNILNVVLYSAITDDSFNRRLVNIIESRWQAQSASDHYRVKIDLKPLKGKPKDGALLTAGAQSTYAELGHAIRLGPGKITENVLAHEFGHVLGFRDLYYRSYRKLNDGSLEIMEVVPASTDIMGNPEFGKVELRHFENLKKVSGRGK